MNQDTRFIGEPITVEFDEPPAFSKKPHCPDRFIWGEETFVIISSLAEWRDYERRGRMAQNMRPEHAAHQPPAQPSMKITQLPNYPITSTHPVPAFPRPPSAFGT